jgi:hypothetical protein
VASELQVIVLQIKSVKQNNRNTMCKLNRIKSTGAVQNRSLFMFSVEAFSGHKGGVPSAMAQCSTGAVAVLFLIAVEMTLRQFFTSIKVRKCNENLVYSRMLSRYNSKSNSHRFYLCFIYSIPFSSRTSTQYWKMKPVEIFWPVTSALMPSALS